jgi:hypothetical protein
MKIHPILILILAVMFIFARDSYSSSLSLEELKSLPYLAWTQDHDTRPSGVLIYDKSKALDGYNLFLDRKKVHLMDMTGKEVYHWTLPYLKGKWQHVGLRDPKRRWQFARLLNDGSIVAVSIGGGFVKLDKNSKEIWAVPVMSNHDIAILKDGTYLVPSVEQVRIYNDRCVFFDSIVHVSTDGKVLDKWSTYGDLKELQKLHFPSLLDSAAAEGINQKPLPQIDKEWNWAVKMSTFPGITGQCAQKGSQEWYEYYHLNSIQVLPETAFGMKDKRFQKGNWLICLRNVDLICILDKDTHKPVWGWGPGILDGPHMPRMLSNGNILLFDNGIHRSYSRVIIIDPESSQVVWEYKANPPDSFYSKFEGSNQLLSNGNILICESEKGQAFEITPGGEIVWEFLNPLIHGKRESISRMMRIPKNEVLGLLGGQE